MADQAGSARRNRRSVGCAILVAAVLVLTIGGLFTLTMGKRAVQMTSLSTIGELSSGEPERMGMPAPASDMAKMEMAEPMPGGAMPQEAPAATPTFLMAAVEAATLPRKIIYTANFTIEADDVDVAANTVEAAVEAAGGHVSQKQVQEYAPGERTCNITVRVPVVKFAELCDMFRGLGEVHSEGIETDDVTEEFVDLEARLTNLRREEGVVAELFERQGKIADILQVERELSRVRGEIEQIQGRLRYLKDRVNYSTITATLYTRHSEAVREMDKWDLGYHVLRAWRALVNVARALTYVVIYTAIVAGPFIVLALVIWRTVRAIRRRRRPEPELPPQRDGGP
jgi:hypothetical protein